MNDTNAAAGEAPACPGFDPHPHAPKFKLPPLACDTHHHIFGPYARYPMQAVRSYTPPEAMSTLLEFSRERPAMEAARPDDEVLRRATEKMKSAGIEPKTKGGVFDHRLSKFAREVCEEDRDLARRYANQSRMAQLEGLG